MFFHLTFTEEIISVKGKPFLTEEPFHDKK